MLGGYSSIKVAVNAVADVIQAVNLMEVIRSFGEGTFACGYPVRTVFTCEDFECADGTVFAVYGIACTGTLIKREGFDGLFRSKIEVYINRESIVISLTRTAFIRIG
ncbi:hypothetical protein [uncultured Allobaculum sp.]|uniref:hypothetical protein n=2 Tax=uncultured Allobaculum sp. TaxID=1187017 RepID=UPI002583F069|nr:hypothetical protein [uncultured Allobaculum sp.]